MEGAPPVVEVLVTYIAMYVGGPRDGDREERPERYVRDYIDVAVMDGPRLLRIGTADNDINPLSYGRTVRYERHPINTDVNQPVPVEVYAPRGMNTYQLLLRLLEYYQPEPDETR